MRVILSEKPFHRFGFGTAWIASTAEVASRPSGVGAIGLFILASAATLTIFASDPFVTWGYEIGIFLLAGYCSVRESLKTGAPTIRIPPHSPMLTTMLAPILALAAISLWGFAQLAIGATVYRYATSDAALRAMACGATAWVAATTLRDARWRWRFLSAFAWFGCALSLVSVVAYFTSPGRILWVFASPYPDVWGPFLSRNDFAGFMELSFPVALLLALDRRTRDSRLGTVAIPDWVPERFPVWVPAWMLAAGLASGSRAGAILLLTEAGVILGLISRRRAAAKFLAWTLLLAVVAGAGTLVGRFAEKDSWRYRREIAASTVNLIEAHPWRGYGLGTYSYVYPAYATFDIGAVVEHAHNQWLEWAAEGGIPLALVWLTLAVGMSVRAVRSVWGIGILAAFLHALVDYPFVRCGLTAWDFALIGALHAAAVRKAGPAVQSRERNTN
jgi:O-antigen ligase